MKCKIAIQKVKFLILIFSFAFLIFNSAFICYAKEITILYTGETHAMLYHCNCPVESDGGIARRATLIKQLKKDHPQALLVDAGGFFAGGTLDEYSQNPTLDMKRTSINLQAMEMMGYDFATLGDDEFNFDQGFLWENIAKSKIKFTSCNIKSDKIAPYIIKEVNGVKIAIIGVTNLLAMQKATGVQFIDPKTALSQSVTEVKKLGAQVTLLLSHLGESDCLNLLSAVQGIDVVISGHSRAKEDPFTKVGSTILLRPEWQGRRLGKLSLVLDENNKITSFKVEEPRLSDNIASDPAITAILPACFSDANCRKQALQGTCQNPAELNARCEFSEPVKINLSVITSKECLTCDPGPLVESLKKQIPGLSVTYLQYPQHKLAKQLVKDLKISGLPAYLFDKQIEKEKSFVSLKDSLQLNGQYYILKAQISGISYYLERKAVKGKFDLFLSLFDKSTPELLDLVKEFNPQIHFLVVENKDGFDASRGRPEVEECLRAVCIQRYYPQEFWNYISCRAKDPSSSWWQDCASTAEFNIVKTCAQGEEGKLLLLADIALNKELQIMFGPTYLVDNQQIFSSRGAPAKEELKKILTKEVKR